MRDLNKWRKFKSTFICVKQFISNSFYFITLLLLLLLLSSLLLLLLLYISCVNYDSFYKVFQIH